MHLNPFQRGETLTGFQPPVETEVSKLSYEETVGIIGRAAAAGFFGSGFGLSLVQHGSEAGAGLMAIGVALGVGAHWIRQYEEHNDA